MRGRGNFVAPAPSFPLPAACPSAAVLCMWCRCNVIAYRPPADAGVTPGDVAPKAHHRPAPGEGAAGARNPGEMYAHEHDPGGVGYRLMCDLLRGRKCIIHPFCRLRPASGLSSPAAGLFRPHRGRPPSSLVTPV